MTRLEARAQQQFPNQVGRLIQLRPLGRDAWLPTKQVQNPKGVLRHMREIHAVDPTLRGHSGTLAQATFMAFAAPSPFAVVLLVSESMRSARGRVRPFSPCRRCRRRPTERVDAALSSYRHGIGGPSSGGSVIDELSRNTCVHRNLGAQGSFRNTGPALRP